MTIFQSSYKWVHSAFGHLFCLSRKNGLEFPSQPFHWHVSFHNNYEKGIGQKHLAADGSVCVYTCVCVPITRVH